MVIERAHEEIERRWLSLLLAIDDGSPDAYVWKNSDRVLEGDGDIDLCAPKREWKRLREIFERWAGVHGLAPVIICSHLPDAMFLVAPDPATGQLFELDVRDRIKLRGATILYWRQGLALVERDPAGFSRLRPGAEAILKLITKGIRPLGRPRDVALERENVVQLMRADPEGAAAAAAMFGRSARSLLKGSARLVEGRWDRRSMLSVDLLSDARALSDPRGLWRRIRYGRARARCALLDAIVDHGRTVPGDLTTWLQRVAETHEVAGFSSARSRGGGTLGVVGPDGSGKSTLIGGLLSGPLSGSQWRHMRSPGLLYRNNRGEGPSVTEPHRDPAYSLILSSSKVAYLFFDYLLAWFFDIRPYTRRGGWVIVERGWWDMAVDPLRYRLDPRIVPLVKALGRFLPRLDVIWVLEALAPEIHGRKQELDVEEIARQSLAWRRLIPERQRTSFLDAGKSRGEVLLEAMGDLGKLGRSDKGWTSLPSRNDARWVLPRSPRCMARSALKIHHPSTLKGIAGWEVARVLATVGGFRLLPGGADIDGPLERLGNRIPPGGALAVSRSNHPGRVVALILDDDGEPCAVAKMALDEVGAVAIQKEVAALEELGPLLPPPLRAPRVIEAADGLMLEEPIDWSRRLTPWRMPSEVAWGLGRFFSRSISSGTRGAVHGDCAPWNLLKMPQGWGLVDWEEARSDGLAFSDIFHFVMQGHALLGRPTGEEIIQGLSGDGWIGRALHAFAEGSGYPFELAPRLLTRFLEESDEAGNDNDLAGSEAVLGARREMMRTLRGIR